MNFRRKLFFEGHFKAIIKPTEGDATDTQQAISFSFFNQQNSFQLCQHNWKKVFK